MKLSLLSSVAPTVRRPSTSGSMDPREAFLREIQADMASSDVQIWTSLLAGKGSIFGGSK